MHLLQAIACIRSLPWAITILMVLGACGSETGRESAAGTSDRPDAPEPGYRSVTEVDHLPLDKGFFVTTDTPCTEASNATLALFLGDGLNWSREACTFTSIQQSGSRAWRVTESCSELGTGDGYVQIIDWTSMNDRQFRRVSEAGWVHEARLCNQTELPEPWRGIDLSDL